MTISPIYNFLEDSIYLACDRRGRYQIFTCKNTQCQNPHVRRYQKNGDYEDNMALRVHAC
ncbi:hypothetical protein BT96DRAFT_926880 [Gymnopus androsaceus JB14]|uniref:Uncharacterized protein n=1 Tax=Gymnopus androsaceus JB14 TaxID=1447944 RepID=A0A6A4GT36_9AGAR|nr:hypothetical protein BT96DRAFT_926880 [Gymnopus androsaceus JB14]